MGVWRSSASRFSLGLLSAPSALGSALATFVFALLHRRGAIATKKMPAVEELHETLMLWVSFRCFHCLEADRTLARAAEFLRELLKFLECFVELFRDVRREVCGCGAQWLLDRFEILAQSLDGFHLLEEHGPGVFARAPKSVGLSQKLPVTLACERKAGLGDILSCSHGCTEKALGGREWDGWLERIRQFAKTAASLPVIWMRKH